MIWACRNTARHSDATADPAREMQYAPTVACRYQLRPMAVIQSRISYNRTLGMEGGAPFEKAMDQGQIRNLNGAREPPTKATLGRRTVVAKRRPLTTYRSGTTSGRQRTTRSPVR